MIASGLSFAWLVLAARQLPIATFGDLVLLLSVAGMAAVMADAGWSFALAAAVGRRPDQGWWVHRAVLGRRAAAGVGASALVVLVAAIADVPTVAALLIGCSIVATTLHSSSTITLRALGSVAPEATNEVASRAFVLVLGTIVLARGGGLIAVTVLYAIADLLSALVLTSMARSRLRALRGPVENELRSAISSRAIAPLWLATVLGSLSHRIGLLIIAALGSPLDVALYGVAARLLDGVLLPFGALSSVVVPRFASLDRPRATASANRVARRCGAIGLPLVAVLFVVSPTVVRLTFGPQFDPAVDPFRILLLAVVPSAVALVLAPLVGLIDARATVRISAAILAANVALNLLLVPRLGPAGAAWATTATQVAYLLLLIRTARRPTGLLNGTSACGPGPSSSRREHRW